MMEKNQNSDEIENYYSTVAIGKTLVFFMYSIFPILIVMAIMELTPLHYVDSKTQNIASLTIWFVLELNILYLIIKDVLPGSKAKVIVPFSEKNLANGITIVSFLPWLLGDTIEVFIIQRIFNSSLIIGIFVFFVIKSVLSRRFRWKILFVLFGPTINLSYSTKSWILEYLLEFNLNNLL